MAGVSGIARETIASVRSNMAVNIIGPVVLLFILLGGLVGEIGIISQTYSIRQEYTETTAHMADAATMFVNGDHLEAYLRGELPEEHRATQSELEVFCHRSHASLVYVIRVDRSDYGRVVCVFEAVDNSVGDTSYMAWELGHSEETSRGEYAEKYRSLYEKESSYETVFRIGASGGQRPHITTIVPVPDSRGEVAGLLCMQRPFSQLQEDVVPYLVSAVVLTFLISVIASLYAARFIRKRVISPIRRVSREATRFARDRSRGEPLGEISRFQELTDLARSIDTMEADLLGYVDHLAEVTAERERIRTELALATRIQSDMLPARWPPFPGRTEFDIYAVMEPAREVGGDFYDLFLVDDDHLYLAVADVSGKGVPAALFMMKSMIVLAHHAAMGKSPAAILRDGNRAICENNREVMFITVWVGILEISTGRLTCANAGHEYPILRRPGERYGLVDDEHGIGLGIEEDAQYEEYELTLGPGAQLLIYTDGLAEAMDSEERMFGTDRILEALHGVPEAGPREALEHLRGAVDAFVGEAEQFDDLTMLCLRYLGPQRDGK